MKQTSFASAEHAAKKRTTRRERFLAEMNAVVPWSRLEALIEPHYPKSGKVGRPPIGVPRMLRMYFLQQWYTLADVWLTRRWRMRCTTAKPCANSRASTWDARTCLTPPRC